MGDKLDRNRVKHIMERLLMSKAELAKRAGVSPLTIDRIEKGMPCRLKSKRKVIQGLGMDLSEKNTIFPQD